MLARPQGAAGWVPWCLEGLAGLAATCGAWAHAGRLCGARDQLRVTLGCGLSPAAPASYARTLAEIREALGDDRYALAYETGSTWSLAEALAEAPLAVPADDRP